MMQALWINGKNYTSYFLEHGYAVSYRKVLGPYSGSMLDGSYVEDVRKISRVLTLPCNLLPADRMGQLLQELYARKYPAIKFYDPRGMGYATSDFIVQESMDAQFRGTGATQEKFWYIPTITCLEVI